MGASSGIGRATALRFAERGAKVVVAARGEPGLRSLVTEIENEGDNLDAPLTGNDTVEGGVGGVTLRHSAYTWWATHKPVC